MKDLFIRRAYTYKNITVVMDIDLVKKTASMVDKGWGDEFKNKTWLFAGRSVEYMDGWVAIFDAMKHATKEAKKILEEEKKRDDKKFVELMVAIGDNLDSKKRGVK